MGFLDALLGGAKALVRMVTTAISEVVIQTVKGLEGTQTGKALATVFESWAHSKASAHKQAADLAAEEAEIAQRMARDGKLRPADWERKQEIDKERDTLREAHANADAARMREDITAAGDEAKVVAANADEITSAIGLLAHKVCGCGGRMAVVTQHRSVSGGPPHTEFEWACPVCRKREKFDPIKAAASVVRTPDLELDLPVNERHRLWNEPETLAETNARLSSHLGESDSEVLCPDHLTPMKLFPSLTASKGRVLDSYAYACTGMTIDGRRCLHRVPLDRMAQASAALRRLEGVGILKAPPKKRGSIYTGGASV